MVISMKTKLKVPPFKFHLSAILLWYGIRHELLLFFLFARQIRHKLNIDSVELLFVKIIARYMGPMSS